MLTVSVDIPRPSRYVKGEVVDTIALEYNKAYREPGGNKRGYPIDIEVLVDLLEIPFLRDDIEEPEDSLFLARYSPTPKELITVNRKHADLFNERPYVYAGAVGHEIGHKALRHSEHGGVNVAEPTLFPDSTPKTHYFHKSSWGQYGMTKEEVTRQKAIVQEIAKRAMISDQAYQVITQLKYVHEPEWMFWQAEHFSRCLLIPKDRLLEQLENPWNLNRWADIYQLAKVFGVSGSMMKKRLEKLGIIRIDEDDKPQVVIMPRQDELFDS